MPSDTKQEQEQLSKKIKHNLENWREILLPAYDVLLWKSVPICPVALFLSLTLLYVAIVFTDPTLLSFISSVGFLAVLLDYLAPIVLSKLVNPDSWTGRKEKKLDEICLNVARTYIFVKYHVLAFYRLKECNPKIYYSVSLLGLASLAILGNHVNNIFLTYLFVTAVLMLPGLIKQGYLDQPLKLCTQTVCKAACENKKTGEKKNK